MRSPSLAAVLNAFKAQMFADMRVSMPARVERYDAATQTADVKPLLKDAFTEEDGSRAIESLPVVTNVPVVFPGAGGFRLTFPVRAGDTVLLVFADRSLDTWLAQGGEASPSDDRRHNLSDAVAIPGLHPNNAPWSGAEEGVVTLGSDAGAADFVALAQKVSTELSSLAQVFTNWVTVPQDGGAALKTLLTALIATGWPHSVASTTVKIKG